MATAVHPLGQGDLTVLVHQQQRKKGSTTSEPGESASPMKQELALTISLQPCFSVNLQEWGEAAETGSLHRTGARAATELLLGFAPAPGSCQSSKAAGTQRWGKKIIEKGKGSTLSRYRLISEPFI